MKLSGWFISSGSENQALLTTKSETFLADDEY